MTNIALLDRAYDALDAAGLKRFVVERTKEVRFYDPRKRGAYIVLRACSGGGKDYVQINPSLSGGSVSGAHKAAVRAVLESIVQDSAEA